MKWNQRCYFYKGAELFGHSGAAGPAAVGLHIQPREYSLRNLLRSGGLSSPMAGGGENCHEDGGQQVHHLPAGQLLRKGDKCFDMCV